MSAPKFAKGFPSAATKRRYQDARKKLGYAQSNNYIDWARLARRTTFIWKHDTLAAAVKWVFTMSNRDFKKHPDSPRADIAMHYVGKAFGVAISDLLDDQRNATVFVPRAVAIITCKLSGMSTNELARQMKRDAASIKNAIKKYSHLFKGLTDGAENLDDSRPAPERSVDEGGPVSS